MAAYQIVRYEAVPRPQQILRYPLPGTTAPTPSPPPVTSGDDSELWVMAGPPPAEPPPGAEPGDAWIDVATGDVFVLSPE